MKLTRIELPESRSGIVQENDGIVYANTLSGREGLFRKDREPSREFGRRLCDEVKELFDCQGFFTTDELPGYGVSRAETRRIYDETGASDADLVLLYAYPEGLAAKIDEYVVSRIRRAVPR